MNALINLHTNRVSLLTNIADHPLGIYTGKMGWCLYLYVMADRYKNEDWNSAASKILCSIFKDIDSVSSVRLSDGLIGIGLGINYLFEQKYVDGNINKVLKEVDNIIFKIVSFSKSQIDYSDKIDALYYFAIRINQLNPKSENYLLFCNLIIFLTNSLSNNLNDKCLETPFLYSLDYKLPFFLFVLSKVWSLNIFNSKIQNIVNELDDKILSIIPRLHSHRLYLMWGMVSLNRCLQKNDWERQIKLLQEQINFNYIINKELKFDNIAFHNGVSSIHFFLKYLKDYFSLELVNRNNELIKDKIVSSLRCRLIENDSSNAFPSFANSISSAIFVLSEILNTEYYESRFK